MILNNILFDYISKIEMINPADFKEGELEAILKQLESFETNPSELEELISKYFAEYDDDNNGFLDRKELRHFLKQFFEKYHIHFPVTDEYVDAVFRKVDTNHDNKIQPEELNTYAKAFVSDLLQQYGNKQ